MVFKKYIFIDDFNVQPGDPELGEAKIKQVKAILKGSQGLEHQGREEKFRRINGRTTKTEKN